MRETGYQLAEIWLSQEMLERVDQGRDGVEDDLKKGRLDRSLAKDRDRWKAQIMGKTSDLCEHGKRDVKLEERERESKHEAK